MAASPIVLFVFPFLFLLFSTFRAVHATFNVVELGATPDGRSDSTKSFISAWASACRSPTPATIYVPQGRFLLKQVRFIGPCKSKAISFKIDGTLVAPSDYNVIGKTAGWLLFQNVSGVSINGGVLDGQGAALWACKGSASNCPVGAPTLEFRDSNNTAISGLTSLNSQLFHIVFIGCRKANLQSVNVKASGESPNTDGIHVEFSSDITVLNAKISTGDDCISIGPGSKNLWIENVNCGPGHGVSIGSLGRDVKEAGVQNVTVKSVTFVNTQNGVRIKTWGRPSTGFVKGFLVQHCTMINVQNPIIIDQNYCPNNLNCPGQSSGVKISDVTYQDIQGTSATEVAVKFDCSKTDPCSGIRLKDVKLTYKNQPANSTCTNAAGTSMGLIEPASCL